MLRPSWLGVSGAPGLAGSSNPLEDRRRRVRLPVRAARTDGASEEPFVWKRTFFSESLERKKRVVIVRHGQSTWNEIGRIQGSSDFSRLTSKGESQANISREMLQSDSFDICIHSPLSRARHTAEIIWDARKGKVIALNDLREIDLYAFQGLHKEQGKELFGDVYRMWKDDPVDFIVDDHYPVRELWERAANCWSNILRQKGSSLLVVAHNAVNQALVGTAIGYGPKYFRQLLQSNCGVSVLDFVPGHPNVCLERLNQTPTSPLSESKSRGSRIILVSRGPAESSIISTKIAEHLLKTPVHSLFSSREASSVTTANVIRKFLSAPWCEPTYLDELSDNPKAGLDEFWTRAGQAWQILIQHLGALQSEKEGEGRTVVVVGADLVLEALVCHCLDLDKSYSGSFQFHAGSLSVIDFPNGALGKGVVRCLNYTAHLDSWAVPVTSNPL